MRWHARGDVRVEEVAPPPPPGPGEVQLRVRWCGICGTDLEEWLSGPLFIPAAAPRAASSSATDSAEPLAVAVRALRRGAVQAAPLITDRIPLIAAVSGGPALLRDEPGEHAKILVRPGRPG